MGGSMTNTEEMHCAWLNAEHDDGTIVFEG